MILNIIIAVFALMLLSASFLIGLFVGIGSVLDVADAEHQRENDLYCFECENETTAAIAKNGRAYCTNCKLYH